MRLALPFHVRAGIEIALRIGPCHGMGSAVGLSGEAGLGAPRRHCAIAGDDREDKVVSHGLRLSFAVAETLPVGHEPVPLRQHLTAPVGSFDFVADGVRQRQL